MRRSEGKNRFFGNLEATYLATTVALRESL